MKIHELHEAMRDTDYNDRADYILNTINDILRAKGGERLTKEELQDWYDVFSDKNTAGFGTDEDTAAEAIAAEIMGERKGREVSNSWDDSGRW